MVTPNTLHPLTFAPCTLTYPFMVHHPIHNPLPQFFNYEDKLNVVYVSFIIYPLQHRVHGISERMNLIFKQGELQNIKIIIT